MAGTRPRPMGTLALAVLLSTGASRAANAELDALGAASSIAAFTVETVYTNESGARIGARFRHRPSRFVLDVLRIQSLPQGFIWVNTPPVSDQGEPHTLEHLLLGKGSRGRYVAALEDMSLGESTAYTDQRQTCYHFNTAAGPDRFFVLLEAKLQAMLHPTFTDEEIRREVCHIGVTEAEGGRLGLEEKGTVYNEMVSSSGRRWHDLYRELGILLYGPDHPLARSAGGLPPDIRTMQPEDIRRFHASTHHLGHMGLILALGDEVTLAGALETLTGILERVEPGAQAGEDPARARDRLPAPVPAPPGTIRQATFPHASAAEPGQMVFAWPARLDLDASGRMALELFFELLAGGETSNLYRRYIDSSTRTRDLGASDVFAWIDDDLGQPVYVGLDNVAPTHCTTATVEAVRGEIMEEIRNIRDLPDGSAELGELRERARGLLLQAGRERRKFLDAPPRFGYRSTVTGWMDLLELLDRQGGFQRDLSQSRTRQELVDRISGRTNAFRGLIDGWGLLDHPPFAVTTVPDPRRIPREDAERRERLAGHVARLRSRFGVDDDRRALERFRDEYDAATRAMEAASKESPVPAFLADPPLELDPGLDHAVETLDGGSPLVHATFENITSVTVGLALDLAALGEDHLLYVPALPTLLREVGVRDGERVLSYQQFEEVLRKEILSLAASYTGNPATGRVELRLEAAGSIRAEGERALHWLSTALFHADLGLTNLSRIRDAIDAQLARTRNRMKESEESWVEDPATAYWKQRDRRYLSAHSFLTAIHALQRVKWRLLQGHPALDADLDEIGRAAASGDRKTLSDRIAGRKKVEGEEAQAAALRASVFDDLEAHLSDLPDATFGSDVAYLCAAARADLAMAPAEALDRIRDILDLLRHRAGARYTLVSNSADRAHILPRLRELHARLASGPRIPVALPAGPVIDERVRSRYPDMERPLFVGLVNPSTTSGVHIHSSDCAGYRDSDPETLLDYLSAQLYSGGGGHGFFMRTWGAGLAYSNGIRPRVGHGRLRYYAERCPDLPQTLRFVISVLEQGRPGPDLADYTVAQAFGESRGGDTYEARGAAMAADLADGLDPTIIRAFRRRILDLRKRDGFLGSLLERSSRVYGRVLPGYGPTSAESARDHAALYFVIGPDAQLESWEGWLKEREPGSRLVRLHPRDFWILPPAGTAGQVR